jgi:hypothetical protein
MNITVTGFPAIVIWVGFLVVVAAPVWLAARMVGAARPTLLRSILALMLGLAGAIASVALTGPVALVLVPLSFLLSFRFVLGTSFLGAIALAALAAIAYAVMIHFVGSGVTVNRESSKGLIFLTPSPASRPA